MEEIYGIDLTTAEIHEYADKALMSPENLDYYHYYYHSLINPVFGSSEELGLIQGSVASQSAASINNIVHQNDQSKEGDEEENHEQDAAYNPSIIKTKIASHPSYPRLLDAYIDCQKVGASPETVCLLDEIIRLEKNLCKQDEVVSMCLGLDPELDQFMETYIEILGKYKSDLSRPFDEAISFFNAIETQLGNLCIDYGGLSSDNGKQIQDTQMKTKDRELKNELLHKYGGEISSLKLKFTKKKKTVKLPKQARQTLVEWWNLHYKWPYPMDADKISLAETTGLDQKQISNWFINQRKRHWKLSENM